MKDKHTFVVLAYKESPYLEECIKSVLNQEYKSKVIIATTTPNKYIDNLAKKYNLKVVVGKHVNIGGDFDFALNVGTTDLVTIAHQDDVYDKDYAKKVIDMYKKYPRAIIIFTDCYEIRNGVKVITNTNLRIKRLLLFPLRLKILSKIRFFKTWVIRYGNAICCPAVTFVKNNCPQEVFASDYKCNVDWYAWKKLSRIKGNFIFIGTKSMGHRISRETTTTEIIKKGIRTKEDYDIYTKFWPKWFSHKICKIYSKSERSNNM